MSDTPAAPRRGRRIFLIASLSLNAFLIVAIVVGVVHAIHRRNDPMSKGGPFSPYALLHDASKDERPKIQAIIDRHKSSERVLRDKAIDARVASFEAFDAPDFTPEKFAASLDKVREADAAVGKDVTDAIVESASVLTPAERKALADKTRRHASWFSHRLEKH